MKNIKTWAITIISMLLIGCGPMEPVVEFSSPESISIYYQENYVTPQEVGVIAKEHCQKHEKIEAIRNRNKDRMNNTATTTFDCR